MFGGQANGYDIHKTGFDAEILAYYLLNVGFTNLERVEEFGLFDDASNLRILDTTISLNIIAYK
jgi:predicted SAM-dependent methyltransferase